MIPPSDFSFTLATRHIRRCSGDARSWNESRKEGVTGVWYLFRISKRSYSELISRSNSRRVSISTLIGAPSAFLSADFQFDRSAARKVSRLFERSTRAEI